MDIVEAFSTKNKCYQVGAPLRPQGIMLHSIGCPQPSAAVLARYFDQYQPGGQSVCVHAFVQADGTVYQTLPWETIAWHCGGSANSTHIGVEMTEPGAGMSYAESAEQITGTYHAAVELFARLAKLYGLDPLPTASSRPRGGTPARRGEQPRGPDYCGTPTAWATRWTGSAATSPRQWPGQKDEEDNET